MNNLPHKDALETESVKLIARTDPDTVREVSTQNSNDETCANEADSDSHSGIPADRPNATSACDDLSQAGDVAKEKSQIPNSAVESSLDKFITRALRYLAEELRTSMASLLVFLLAVVGVVILCSSAFLPRDSEQPAFSMGMGVLTAWVGLPDLSYAMTAAAPPQRSSATAYKVVVNYVLQPNGPLDPKLATIATLNDQARLSSPNIMPEQVARDLLKSRYGTGAPAHELLAKSLYYKQDFRSAIALLQRSLTLRAKDEDRTAYKETQLFLFSLCAASGDWQKILEYETPRHSALTDNQDLLCWRIDALFHLKRFSEAEKLIDSESHWNTAPAALALWHDRLLVQAGKIDEALDRAQSRLKTSNFLNESDYARVSLAEIFAVRGQFDEALQQAKAVDPYYTNARENAVRRMAILNRLHLYSDSLKLSSNQPPQTATAALFFALRAESYLNLGDYRKCEENLLKALSINPDLPLANEVGVQLLTKHNSTLPLQECAERLRHPPVVIPLFY